MNKFDFNTNGKVVHTDYSHNETGNPHPQYTGPWNYRIIPKVGYDKYIKLFSIVKKDAYKYTNTNCALISMFRIFRVNSADTEYSDIMLSVQKKGTSVTPYLSCATSIATLYKSIFVKTSLNGNDLTVDVYFKYPSSSVYYGIQNILNFSSSEGVPDIDLKYNYVEEFGKEEATLTGTVKGVQYGGNVVFRESVPGSANSGGTLGTVACDDNALYIKGPSKWLKFESVW